MTRGRVATSGPGEARLNAETAERVAAEKTGVVTRSAARAKANANAKAAEEETARQTHEAERARREEQSSAAKRKAAEAKEAAKTRKDAKLAASEAEAKVIAKAIQEVNAPSAAQQTPAPSTPLKEPKKPRLAPRVGLSMEEVELAQNGESFGTAEGDGSNSDNSTEERQREKHLSARVEEMKRHTQGAAMKGKEHWLIDAEARSELLRGRDLSDLDSYPWKIEIEVTVNGYIRDSCKTGTLVVTSSLWLIGSKGSMTIQEFHQFNAQDLGQWHNAPTKEDDEDQYKLYSNEHGTEAHKSHIEKDALLDAWRAEEDLKLCEQMQKEWESSGPTPPDDPGGAGRSGHGAAKAKAGEDSEAGEAGAVAKNKEGAAPTNKFKLAHFQQLRPRSGAYSGFQDRQCEPLISRPMAVD